MDEQEAVATIVDLGKTKEDRIQAAFQLEQAQDEASLQKLCAALKSDPSPIVRHEFAFVLGETGRSDIVAEALKDSVRNDPNVFVRHEAILALATLGNKEFIPFVKEFLDDPEIEMAESAEIALQRLMSA